MFTIADTVSDRTCAGLGRRDFLRVGSLTLPGLMRVNAEAPRNVAQIIADGAPIPGLL